MAKKTASDIDLTPMDDRPDPAATVSPDVPGGDLIGDDWNRADAAPSPAADPAELLVEPMDESEVAAILQNVGGFAGWVLPTADAPDLWHLTADEIGSIAPPLTRVLNKRPRAIMALQRTDELTVAANIGRYALTRMAYLRTAAEDESAPEGTDHGTGLDADRTREVFPNA